MVLRMRWLLVGMLGLVLAGCNLPVENSHPFSSAPLLHPHARHAYPQPVAQLHALHAHHHVHAAAVLERRNLLLPQNLPGRLRHHLRHAHARPQGQPHSHLPANYQPVPAANSQPGYACPATGWPAPAHPGCGWAKPFTLSPRSPPPRQLISASRCSTWMEKARSATRSTAKTACKDMEPRPIS